MSLSQQGLRQLTSKALLSSRVHDSTICSKRPLVRQYASNPADTPKPSQPEPLNDSAKSSETQQPKKKSQAELDKELQLKMSGLSGDGGELGIEYEDGQPTSMKRSVRNNMFRYI